MNQVIDFAQKKKDKAEDRLTSAKPASNKVVNATTSQTPAQVQLADPEEIDKSWAELLEKEKNVKALVGNNTVVINQFFDLDSDGLEQTAKDFARSFSTADPGLMLNLRFQWVLHNELNENFTREYYHEHMAVRFFIITFLESVKWPEHGRSVQAILDDAKITFNTVGAYHRAKLNEVASQRLVKTNLPATDLLKQIKAGIRTPSSFFEREYVTFEINVFGMAPSIYGDGHKNGGTALPFISF